MLAGTGFRAPRQRRAYGDARVHASNQVRDGDAGLLRTPASPLVTLTGDAHEAAHALDHEVVSRPLTPRPSVAETGNRTINETSVCLLDLCIVEAIALEVAELEILEQHVALRCKLACDRAALRAREIECDRLLTAIGTSEIRRIARVAPLHVFEPRRTEGARVVAFLRPLDFDHLRSE